MAAGLGFKTFTTGEVLTAADTNGYLMQGVLVFADAAARTAAVTSPQEGQTSYLKDTDSVESYSGTAWVAVGGSVATSLGFTAGKNAIINGDFRFNQRSFTSNTTTGSYNFDRWLQTNSGGSFTVTPQTFTPGAAPISGYEGSNFLRGVTAAQASAGDYALFTQRVEDVRSDAGTTVAVSFFAKANTGTPKIGVELSQNFGTGGSPSSQVDTPAGSITLTTSWARYTVSVAVPSISGKTIGTDTNSSYLELNLWTSSGATNATRASSIGIQNFTADIWGVQLEQGTSATAFQTATGTVQGELAACQRYYWRTGESSVSNPTFTGQGFTFSSTGGVVMISNPVQMRVKTTAVDFSALRMYDITGAAAYTITALTIGDATPVLSVVNATVSGATANRVIRTDGSASSAFIGFSAEL
jgi:hypothetical protein